MSFSDSSTRSIDPLGSTETELARLRSENASLRSVVRALATHDPGMKFRICWEVIRGQDGRLIATMRGVSPVGRSLASAFRHVGCFELASLVEDVLGCRDD